MRVGLFLTSQQRLGANMAAAFREQIDMVRLARDAGWDSLFSGQHYLNEGDSQQLQPVPFLARLQAEAGGMTIGLGVLLLNLHNPVYVAETVASLDVICGGRFVFGVGLGYREVEFDAFRVPRGQRAARFEETLALVRRLWSGEPVTHDSAIAKLDGVRMHVRPIQRPCPPIWIAANSDAAVRRAARLGDAWFMNPHATLATLRRQLAIYREARAAAGLGPPAALPALREVYCAPDRETALRLAGPALGAKYADYARWGQDRAMPGGERFARPFGELRADRFVIGSPGECLEQLRPLRDELGVTDLIVRTHWAGMRAADSLASMRLISDELLPELRRL